MTEREIKAPFRPGMSIAEAREVLRPLAAEEGAECPCCTQNVKVHPRRITGAAARALVALYEEHGTEFGHLPSVAEKRLPGSNHQGGYLNLTQHWGLMEAERRRRPDGGRTGYWRVTELGVRFLREEATVPEYARVFNGECLALVGNLVSIRDALGEGFDFSHLVRLTRPPAENQALPLFDGQAAA